MFSNVKAVFIDIDETLRTTDKKISNINKAAIKEAIDKGIYIVLTSGRNYEFVKKIAEDAETSQYIICSNGGLIINRINDEIIYHSTIKKEKMKLILEYCYDREAKFLINAGTHRLSNKLNHDNDIYISSYKEYNKLEHYLNNSEQIVINRDSYEDVLKTKEFIDNLHGLNVSNYSKPLHHRHWINISNPGVSKANAIIKFCEHFNISLDETMSIGDAINDISMFEVTKHKVAMGNAIQTLKDKSTYITDTNDNNGVAKVLNLIKSD